MEIAGQDSMEINTVLSARLADPCSSPASHYDVAVAEYQAGDIGADGTQPLDDDALPPNPLVVGLVPNQASEAEAPTADEWEDFDPYCLMLQAKDAAEAVALNDEGTDAMWGLYSLIEKAVEKVLQAVEQKESDSQGLFDKASDELAGTLAILRLVNNDGVDSSLLYAVETLIKLTKKLIDAKILQLVRGAA